MRTVGINSEKELEKSSSPNPLLVPETFTHSCAIGQTGCGKTSSYIYPNIEDRLRKGHSLLIYDYKGKEHAVVKALAKKHGRLNDVIEIGKPWGEKINLIKYLNDAELKNFMETLYMMSPDNSYWATSAVNYSTSLITVQRALKEFMDELRKIGHEKSFSGALKQKHRFKADATLNSISDIVSSVESLSNYLESLDPLIKALTENMGTAIAACQTDDAAHSEFGGAVEKFCLFEDAARECGQTLGIFTKVTITGNTANSHIFAMNGPLNGIASYAAFNADETDLVKALNGGKIVIVQTNGISDTILGHFTATLLRKMSMRSHLKHVQPVSVFIDEMQRIVNENTDLPIDVLREARVELFLAFQNCDLVIERMGKHRFNALYQNLSTRYIFKNPGMHNGFKTGGLGTFEYHIDESDDRTLHRSAPLFVDEKNLFDSELKYQKKKGSMERYGFDTREKKILVYDSAAYMEGKMLLLSEQGEYELMPIRDEAVTRRADEFISSVLAKRPRVENGDTLEDLPF